MKNNIVYSSLLSLGIIAFSSSSYAQDIDLLDVIDRYDWSGFYIGVEGSYSKEKSTSTSNIKEEKIINDNGSDNFTGIACGRKCPKPRLPKWPEAVNPPFDKDNLPSFNPVFPIWPSPEKKVISLDSEDIISHQEGLTAGLYTGYNIHFNNNIVLGITSDFVLGNMESLTKSFKKEDYSSVLTELEIKRKYNVNTLFRVGYGFNRFLPYLSAGISYADFDIKKSDTFDIDGTIKNIKNLYNDGKLGYVLGTGIDYALTDNVIAKFEYRHSEYGKVDVGIGNELKINSDDFIVGVSYKF